MLPSPIAMRRTVRRLIFSFVGVMAVLLTAGVAIAKIISIVDTPHDAAHALETALGGYWPLILVVVVVATLGIALYPLRRRGTQRL